MKLSFLLTIAFAIGLSANIFAQCPTPVNATCSMTLSQYDNVVISEVSGDAAQSDGSNDGIVELAGPPGTIIGCMVVSNSEWAVLIPPGTTIPADGTYLIACGTACGSSFAVGIVGNNSGLSCDECDFPNLDGMDDATYCAMTTNGSVTNGQIDLDVCDPDAINIYDPAGTGFTLDNANGTDGDAVALFLPDGTPHDGLFWGGGASGNTDFCAIQTMAYTLGDNDGNGIVNDNPTSVAGGRCDGNTATAVPILPTDAGCPCNTPGAPGTFTIPDLANTFWYNNPSPVFSGCNSSYARLDAGTSGGGAQGAPSHTDGFSANGTSTAESFSASAFTPSSCGTPAAEWAYSDHPTPGLKNDTIVWELLIDLDGPGPLLPVNIDQMDEALLCSAGPIQFIYRIHNYQHVSDATDTGSGASNLQTGSLVNDPIAGLLQTWTTYTAAAGSNITELTYDQTLPAGSGSYTFDLVWDDYSNCCGTSGNPGLQSNPNECYEAAHITVEVVAPITITDTYINCDAGDSPAGAINVASFITGGTAGQIAFELFSDSLPTAANRIDTNGTGAFLLNTNAILPTPAYSVIITDLTGCSAADTLYVANNCEQQPVCPENFDVTASSVATGASVCPTDTIQLCFSGDELPAGGILTWYADGVYVDTINIPEASCTPNVLITELSDPSSGWQDNRFAEICNSGPCAADLTGWSIVLVGNNSADKTITLSGSLAVGACAVIAQTTNTLTIPLGTPTFTFTGTPSNYNGQSRDGAVLFNGTVVVDVAVINTGDNNNWFENKTINRLSAACTPTGPTANGMGAGSNLCGAAVSTCTDLTSNWSTTNVSPTPGTHTFTGCSTVGAGGPFSGALGCISYIVPLDSCNTSIDFQAIISPFDGANCPVDGSDEPDSASAIITININCPEAFMSDTVIALCAPPTTATVDVDVSSLTTGQSYVIFYTLGGVNMTEIFTASAASETIQITITGTTAGEVKLQLDSIWQDTNGLLPIDGCSGVVNDAESCIKISPEPTVTSIAVTPATVCNPCDGSVTFTLTGNGPFDLEYTIDGGAPTLLGGVGNTVTLSNACPGVYDLFSLTDEGTCAGDTTVASATVIDNTGGTSISVTTQPLATCNDGSGSIDLTTDVVYSPAYVAANFQFFGIDPSSLNDAQRANPSIFELPTTVSGFTSSQTIFVQYTDAGGCVSIDTVRLQFLASACANPCDSLDPEFTYSADTFCNNNVNEIPTHVTGYDGEYTYTGAGILALDSFTGEINFVNSTPGTYVVSNRVRACGNLVITGVIDGPLPGGLPKAIELYVVADIPNISQYGFGSANNGGGTDGQEYTFPATGATAGTYITVTSDSAAFATFFGFSATFVEIGSNALSINGDDAIELFCNGEIVDYFGDRDTDGTGEPWEYLDGWAYRNNNTGPDTTFTSTDWTYSGRNALDGETDNGTAATPMPVGTYTTTAMGCTKDSSATFSITILAVDTMTIDTAICSGTMVTLGSNTFIVTADTMVFDSLMQANGCDSIITYDVTELLPPSGSGSALLCPGDSVQRPGGSFATSAGTYMDTLTAGNGCDSIVTFTVTSIPDAVSVSNAIICPGDSVQRGNGVYVNITGAFSDTLVNMAANGCDSIVNLTVILLTNSDSTLNVSLCQGDSAQRGNGQFEMMAGSYVDTLVNQAANGCDSIVTLNIVALPNANSMGNFIICPGDSVQLGDGSFTTMAGTFTDTLANSAANGCDSIVTIVVNTFSNASATINQSICPGDSVQRGNGSFETMAGMYVDTLINAAANGCDSVVTLNVTLLTTPSNTINANICPGDSVQRGNSQFVSIAGTFIDTLTAANGCDSIVTLNVTAFTNATNVIVASICPGDSIQRGSGEFVSVGGIFVDTLANAALNGCDSVIAINLSLLNNANNTINANLCVGDSAQRGNGSFETMAGMYVDTLVNAAANGCDSIVTLNIVALPSATSMGIFNICSSDSVQLGDGSFTATAGTFTDTIKNGAINGCDSIITITVIVLSNSTNTINANICLGDSVQRGNGQFVSVAATFIDTVPAVNGCDSVVTLNVVLLPSSTSTLNIQICDGDSYTFDGITYTNDVMVNDTLMAINGCDSVVTLNLSVAATITNTINESICQNNTYVFGGNTYSSDTMVNDTLMSAAGCDSVVTLNLTVNPTYNVSTNTNACFGSSVTVGATTLFATKDTSINENYSTLNGCDSNFVYNITIISTDTAFIDTTVCSGTLVTINFVNYSATGNVSVFQRFGKGVSGCDSLIQINFNVLQLATATNMLAICQGDSILANGVFVFPQMDTMFETIIASGAGNGCDSIITNTVMVNNDTSSTVNAVVCSGDAITINGSTFMSLADTMVTQLFANGASNGCDSIVLWNITINQTTSSSTSTTICSGDSVLLSNGMYTSAAGTFTNTFSASNGCDSVINETVIVLSTPVITVIDTSKCNRDTLLLGNLSINTPGIYYDTLPASNSCDSIIEYRVCRLFCPFPDTIYVSACATDTIIICPTADDLISITSTGIFRISAIDSLAILDTISGCFQLAISSNITLPSFTSTIGVCAYGPPVFDTICNNQTVPADTTVYILRFDEVQYDTLQTTICQGDSILLPFNNSYADSAGLYFFTLDGCDSSTVVDLIVLPNAISGVIDTSVCANDSVIILGQSYLAGSYNILLPGAAVNSCDSSVIITVNSISCNIISPDTVRASISAGDTLPTICPTGNDLSSIDSFLIVDCLTGVAFGNWTMDTNGCLVYVAGSIIGNSVDTLCGFAFGNGIIDTTVIIISISNPKCLDFASPDSIADIILCGSGTVILAPTGGGDTTLNPISITGPINFLWDFETDSSGMSSSPAGVANPTILGDSVNHTGYFTGRNFIGQGYTANSWTSGITRDANDYFEFCVTPSAGNNLFIDSLGFYERASGSGPNSFDVTYLINGINETVLSSSIATATNVMGSTSWGTYSNNSSVTVNDGDEICYRVYGYSSSSPFGSFRMDSVSLYGTFEIPGSTGGNTNYNFYADSGLTILLSGDTTDYPQFVNEGDSITIYITAVDDSCESDPIAVNIYSKVQPVLASIPDTLFCIKDLPANLQLINPQVTSGSGTGIHVWYNDAGGFPNVMAGPIPGQSVSAPGTYWVIYTENGCSAQTSVLLDTMDCTTTPIELIDYSVSTLNCNVTLNWSSGSEYNSDSYIIERSTNGFDFVEIGTLKSAGNSSSTLHYQFVDENAPSGTVYYRLLEKDVNNNLNFLVTMVADNQCLASVTVTNLYPNPTSSVVTIDITAHENATLNIRLIDVLGRIIYENPEIVSVGKTSFIIDVSHLAGAMYFIEITDEVNKPIDKVKFSKIND